MIKCKICGSEFVPRIDEHYVSRDSGRTGVVTVFSNDEPKLYDTFDCRACGCQIIAQERKRRDVPIIQVPDIDDEEDEEYEEDDRR